MTGIDLTDKKLPKPPWLRVKIPHGSTCREMLRLIRAKKLHTVCESALCPNMGECWSHGEATFMILGNACTRNCRFCAVSTKSPAPPDPSEPEEVAEAVAFMELSHAVITSVTRDDLDNGGADHFAETIRHIRRKSPATTIEVLIPDFKGDRSALETVLDAAPEVLAHNMETVARLYPEVRPQADYQRSLDLLKHAKIQAPGILTKSGIMVGLGETMDEIEETLRDLRQAGCDMLTAGQYLRPTPDHLPLVRYYTPEEFKKIETLAYELGFGRVASGPLVRSSYRAGRHLRELLESDI